MQVARRGEKMDFSQEKMGNFWSRREAQRQYKNSLIILTPAEPRGRDPETICCADFILSRLVLVLHTNYSDFQSQKLLCASWCSSAGSLEFKGLLLSCIMFTFTKISILWLAKGVSCLEDITEIHGLPVFSLHCKV